MGTELPKPALEVVLDRATPDARRPKAGVDTRWRARSPLGNQAEQRAVHEREVLELARRTADHDADPPNDAAIASDARPLSPERLRVDALASHGTAIDSIHEIREAVTGPAVYAGIISSTIAADVPQRLIERHTQRHVSAGVRTRPNGRTAVGA